MRVSRLPRCDRICIRLPWVLVPKR
jgi:hypothetical protein